jgi:O-antigen/teichoic acid export membrane protein
LSASADTASAAGGGRSPGNGQAGGDGSGGGGSGGGGSGSAASREFASGARILSVGIASTGLFTFAYLALASNLLSPADYSRVSVCWAVMYVILCVIYRPVEQLLSRTIADRHARGDHAASVLKAPATIQASFAMLFLGLALVLRHDVVHGLFKGSNELFWILVVGVMAYAGSYFARGWLAGNRRFALYGALVFLESTSRFVFAIAAAVAAGSHLGPVALGMAVAPFASLTVIPFAFRRVSGASAGGAGAGLSGPASASASVATAAVERADVALASGPAAESVEPASQDLSVRQGSRFAVAVVAIMASEQTLMNAGVLIVALGKGGGDITNGLAGFVFNVLLIVRAPLQLFQALQTSILPHLTSMEASGSDAEFRKAIRITVLVIGAFAGLVAVGLLAIGPFVMSHVLQSHAHGAQHFSYDRFGLACVGIGMGLHLGAGTLNQALLARGRAARAAFSWLCAAAVFVLFVAFDVLGTSRGDKVWGVEVGYLLATAVLAALLGFAYRGRSARPVAARYSE